MTYLASYPIHPAAVRDGKIFYTIDLVFAGCDHSNGATSELHKLQQVIDSSTRKITLREIFAKFR